MTNTNNVIYNKGTSVCGKGDDLMIKVEHISKEFVSSKKYPGLKGAIKGLFSNEKVRKKLLTIFLLILKRAKSLGISEAMVQVNLPPLR